MTVSPYELLRASRPQSPHSVVTPYDLYSRIQQDAPPYEQKLIPSASQPASSENAHAAALTAPKRTHYISDIHTKHSTAGRRTSFINQPL